MFTVQDINPNKFYQLKNSSVNFKSNDEHKIGSIELRQPVTSTTPTEVNDSAPTLNNTRIGGISNYELLREKELQRVKELRRKEELRREKELHSARYLSKLDNCDKLPEQIELVKNMLNYETRNLTNGTDENCEKLTKAIQDKNGKIPSFGLSFLCSLLFRSNSDLLDLIAAVESVKGDDGIINIEKCHEFSNILSRNWGDIPKAVQEINKQGTLLKATKI